MAADAVADEVRPSVRKRSNHDSNRAITSLSSPAARARPVSLASVLLLVTYSTPSGAQAGKQRTFASPEEAVKTLITVVKAGNLDELTAIFGPDGKELIASSDPATGRQNREVFTVATNEQWSLTDDGPNRKTLIIGHEEWPFPVPLVKEASGWRFDTAAGKEEVIARRIGRNELAAIDTVARVRGGAAALRAAGTRREGRRRVRDEVPK